MKVYKTRECHRLCRKSHISDGELLKAAKRIKTGKVDASLGAHLAKQRLSQGQGGRAHGHRAIVAVKTGQRIVFLHVFAKKDQDNLTAQETAVYRQLAKAFAEVDDGTVDRLLALKEWIEIDQGTQILQE